jgi:chloramphenicol O-acetyltransferase
LQILEKHPRALYYFAWKESPSENGFLKLPLVAQVNHSNHRKYRMIS